MAIQIREALTDEDLFKCFRLRYKTYVEEMQRPQEFADHDLRITKEPYDEYGHNLLAEEDGEVIATLRMSMRSDGPLECEELYELQAFDEYFPEKVGMVTKFVIRPDHRKTSVAGRMALSAYQFGRDNGIQFCIIDSYPHLVQLYLQLGYRFFMKNIRHPDYGSVIPMVLVLEDIEYFRKIRSPIYRIAKKYENRGAASAFFEAQFSHYKSVRPVVRGNSHELFSDLSNEIARNPKLVHFKFLDGLSAEEVGTLLLQLPTLTYEPGEFVFRQGDQSLGMFCMMRGQVEVIHQRKGKEKTVAILNDGDIFGEMGFIADNKRTATIRVREPSEVLVLAPSNLEKIMTKTPALGNKFVTNLFKCVVDRYTKLLNQKSTSY